MKEAFTAGEKVKLLNENLNGVIVGKAGPHEWLVRIEGDMEIPFPENELISEEAVTDEAPEVKFQEPNVKESLEAFPPGVYLVFATTNSPDELDLFVLNEYPQKLLFAIHLAEGGGLAWGEVNPHQIRQQIRLRMQDFDRWNKLNVEGIFYTDKEEKHLAAFQDSVHFSGKQFTNALRKAPYFEEDAHIIQVDVEEVAKSQKKEIQFRQRPTMPEISIEVPSQVVDLHIENLLGEERKLMQPAQILEYQHLYFKTSLEKGIALNYPKMVFIHGIGNGILRQKIRNYLMKQKHVKLIRDADARQYGAGATEVVFN